MLTNAVELKSALITTFIQTSLFANNWFGLALFNRGLSLDPPPLDINIGYANELQLKFIWLSRWFIEDQFLFSNYEKKIHDSIYHNLITQYEQNNWTEKDLITSIPTFDFKDITSDEFLKEYVQKGIPVVIKNFQNKAYNLWSTEYFHNKYGNHVIEVQRTVTAPLYMS